MKNEILKPTPIGSTHYSREKCGFVSWVFFILKSAFLINTKKFSFCRLHTLPSIHPKSIHLHRDNSLISQLSTWFLTPSLASRKHPGCQHTRVSAAESLSWDCGHQSCSSLPSQPSVRAAALHAQLLPFCNLCLLPVLRVPRKGDTKW